MAETTIQLAFKEKGEFKYDSPHLGHKWYERIKTELYEKDGQLFYFTGVSKWYGNRILAIKLGKIENKNDKNPECIYKESK